MSHSLWVMYDDSCYEIILKPLQWDWINLLLVLSNPSYTNPEIFVDHNYKSNIHFGIIMINQHQVQVLPNSQVLGKVLLQRLLLRTTVMKTALIDNKVLIWNVRLRNREQGLDKPRDSKLLTQKKFEKEHLRVSRQALQALQSIEVPKKGNFYPLGTY